MPGGIRSFSFSNYTTNTIAYTGWQNISNTFSNVRSFGEGIIDGFGAGVDSTIGFFKSLGTAEGWKSLGQGIVNLAKIGNNYSVEGHIMRVQMANSVYNYVENIPNMSAYEMGYDLGYGAEKAVEAIALTRGAGLATNAVRSGVGAAKGVGKVKFPGTNPTKAPKGFEWRGKPGSTPGSKGGNWYNPKTGESLRPDLNHPKPIGPHWDYKDPTGKWWRIFSDGSNVPK